MESFVHDYITSNYDGEISEGLIERRISPYATLRAGDLTALLRLSTLKAGSPFPLLTSVVTRSLDNDFNDNFVACNDLDDECKGVDDCTRGKDGEKASVVDIVCRGVDTNDSPAEYTVKGLHPHEMPVMGVYVDKRICPGFQYLVRRADSDGLVFKSPKTLLSVGMGYGKRITFSSHTFNNNDCFFWSDSEPSGYAFRIHAVDIGHRFSILDADNKIVGEAVVEHIPDPQVETSSVVKDRQVTKHVNVTMHCSMKYYQRLNHGLVEIMVHEDTETVSGVAVLTKSKSSKKANLTSIEQIYLSRFGLCKFELDV